MLAALTVPHGAGTPGRPRSLVRTAAPVPVGPARDAAVLATLTGTRLLTCPGSAKEVRQFSLDTSDGELIYEVGDALSVRPVNHRELVAEWFAITRLHGEETVEVPDLGSFPLAEALHRHLDITKITPGLLGFVAERARDRHLKALLRPGNTVELSKWTWERQAADVIAEFPVRACAQDWTNVLKRLQPRLYSISSSPLASPPDGLGGAL